MDVTLRRDERASDLAIATFGDHELLDFLQCGTGGGAASS